MIPGRWPEADPSVLAVSDPLDVTPPEPPGADAGGQGLRAGEDPAAEELGERRGITHSPSLLSSGQALGSYPQPGIHHPASTAPYPPPRIHHHPPDQWAPSHSTGCERPGPRTPP